LLAGRITASTNAAQKQGQRTISKQRERVAGEIFVRRDSVERLAAGVRRLKKLTRGISDAELDRWYRVVVRFQRSYLDTRQQLARPDALAYLAAALLNAAEMAAERRRGRKILVRQVGVRSLLSTQVAKQK
jgi:hypothetical protein